MVVTHILSGHMLSLDGIFEHFKSELDVLARGVTVYHGHRNTLVLMRAVVCYACADQPAARLLTHATASHATMLCVLTCLVHECTVFVVNCTIRILHCLIILWFPKGGKCDIIGVCYSQSHGHIFLPCWPFLPPGRERDEVLQIGRASCRERV